MPEATAALQSPEQNLLLESGDYDLKNPFTITYVIYSTGMDGPKVHRRLLVKVKHIPNPPQDAGDLTYTCETQESPDGK